MVINLNKLLFFRLKRTTDVMFGGKQVIICGYGEVSQRGITLTTFGENLTKMMKLSIIKLFFYKIHVFKFTTFSDIIIWSGLFSFNSFLLFFSWKTFNNKIVQNCYSFICLYLFLQHFVTRLEKVVRRPWRDLVVMCWSLKLIQSVLSKLGESIDIEYVRSFSPCH